MISAGLHNPDLVLVVSGPTASGKSALAIELCEELAKHHRTAEILCADSITLFRGFDIGSAKPSAEERARIPHHLLDLCDPMQNFTAGDFILAANKIIRELHSQKKIPVLVGGTGFYLRALLQGMTEQTELETERAIEIKQKLALELSITGIQPLYEKMLQLDPALLGKIHANDHYRVLRALQAMESTGERWSELNEKAKAKEADYKNSRFFCLQVPREILRERVHARTMRMIQEGIIEETRELLNAGVSRDAKPLQSVGYKEVLGFLEGKISFEELPALIEQETMRLAKRQSTWFRGEKRAEWVENLAAIRASLMLGSSHD